MRAVAAISLLLLSATAAAADEIIIERGSLRPPVLTTTTEQPVTFVNRSDQLVHVDFLGRADEHQVFQVPGQIRAIFHRPGRHPYVVHFEPGRREELRGVVEVEPAREAGGPPVCTGRMTVEEICIEP